MIEVRRGKKYIDIFHEKYPKDLIIVKSEPFIHGRTMIEMAKWTQENFQGDARMDLERAGEENVRIIWYCVSELDALAAKMRWV